MRCGNAVFLNADVCLNLYYVGGGFAAFCLLLVYYWRRAREIDSSFVERKARAFIVDVWAKLEEGIVECRGQLGEWRFVKMGLNQ
mmetsp:Transcript_2002/g.4261  ORF Transcript_2002/g.4261 Transcript_2002/m.4261 type:complete len:85 (-) Transcript_2002:404-658(-)